MDIEIHYNKTFDYSRLFTFRVCFHYSSVEEAGEKYYNLSEDYHYYGFPSMNKNLEYIKNIDQSYNNHHENNYHENCSSIDDVIKLFDTFFVPKMMNLGLSNKRFITDVNDSKIDIVRNFEEYLLREQYQ